AELLRRALDERPRLFRAGDVSVTPPGGEHREALRLEARRDHASDPAGSARYERRTRVFRHMGKDTISSNPPEGGVKGDPVRHSPKTARRPRPGSSSRSSSRWTASPGLPSKRT